MSISTQIVKIVHYIALVCVLCAYMSKTDVRTKDDYPNKDTTAFFLLKKRLEKIDGQLLWLFVALGIHCLSLSDVIEEFNVSNTNSLLIACGLFILGGVVSLIYSSIKKSPIDAIYEHNDEKGLSSKVADLEPLYNASKYMIYGTLLLCFVE